MLLITSAGTFNVQNINDLPLVENHDFKPNEVEVLSILANWFKYRNIEITTSGSTGFPSKVTLEENLIRWSVNQTSTALSLKNEKVFLCISASKIGGAMMVMRCLLNNWNIVVAEAQANPMQDLDVIHDYTFTSLVPYQLTQIFKDQTSTQKLAQFNNVLVGGSAISTELEKQIKSFASQHKSVFYHTYGMTETASHVALRKISEHSDARFEAFQDVFLSTTANGGASISIPAISFEIETNDVLKMEGNKFNYLGRLDDVVNSGGLKIQLQEITVKVERELHQLGFNFEFFFWRQTNEVWGEMLVLVIRQDAQLSVLMNVINNCLLSVERPKKIYRCDAFERTVSGKIDRQATLLKSVEVGG